MQSIARLTQEPMVPSSISGPATFVFELWTNYGLVAFGLNIICAAYEGKLQSGWPVSVIASMWLLQDSLLPMVTPRY